MADRQNNDRVECGVSGVPFNLPAEMPISKLGGPASDWLTPKLTAHNPNPEEIVGANLIQYGDSNTTAGYLFQRMANGRNLEVIHLKGQEPITFNDLPSAIDFLKNNNLRSTAKENIKTRNNYVLGFSTANEFSAAAPWTRQAAMFIARLDGNLWESAQTVRALQQRVEMAGLDRWQQLVKRWNTSNADMETILSGMPDNLIDNTFTGRIINAGKWAQQNIFDNLSVVDDPQVRGDRAPVRAELERMRGEMNQAVNGEMSPVKTMRRQVNAWLKRWNLTAQELGRYRMALHTPERIAMVEGQYKSAYGKDPRSADIAYANRNDPLHFRFSTERNGRTVELAGQEAADAYLKSLDPTVRSRLDAINKLLTNYVVEQLKHRVAGGVGFTQHELEDFIRRTPNYIPARDDVEQGFMGAKNPYGLVGRSSDVIDPERQLFSWLDGQTRAVWLNAYRRNIVDAIRDNPLNGLVHVEFQKAVRTPNGLTWKLPRDEEENTVHIWYPPENEGEPPTVAKVTVDTSNYRGKGLARLLTNQNKEAVLSVIAGTTRFQQMMFTTLQPAFVVKNLVWNMGITPFALQSAGQLTSGEATNLLSGPFWRNVVGTFKAGLMEARGKTSADQWRLDVGRTLGAGSLSESRFSPTQLGREWDYNSAPLRDRLRDAPMQTLLEGGARIVNGGLHIAHTPDLAFQYGTFWTLLEHYAGRSFKNEGEFRAWSAIPTNNDLVTKALNGSRRVLPNFANQGNMRALSAWFPFFNATVQSAPFAAQMWHSGYGKAGFALALALGFMGKEIAYNEFGDQADTMRGEEGGIYLGNGISVPMDYLWHLPMAIGSGMSQLSRGRIKTSDYLADIGRSAVSSFSPIELPWKTQSWGAWAEQVVLPPVLQAPVMVMNGTDSLGHPAYNENPADAQGHKILNPRGWQEGRPQDSVWATQMAHSLDTLTGHLVNLAPGQISTLVQSYTPVVATTLDATEGNRTMANGGTPSILNSIRDAIAPNFTSSPTYSGEQARFMETYRGMIGPGSTHQALIGGQSGPLAQRAEIFRQQASKNAENIRIEGMTGPQLSHEIAAAQQARDYANLQRLQNLEGVLRQHRNAVWSQFADKLEDLQHAGQNN